MRRSWMVLLVAFCGSLTVRPAAGQEGARPSLPFTDRPSPESEGPGSRFEDPVETDRDSFTPSTRTAGKNRLIFETSYSFVDNRDAKETHSFPELLLRYGAAERLELRFGFNYEVGGESSSVSGSGGEGDEFREGPEEAGENSLTREARVLYGLKALLTERRGPVPESSVIVQGFTPTGGDPTDSQVAAAYVFGWELENRWKFDAAVRYQTGSEEEDHFGVLAPSAVLRVPVGERVNVHAEYFGLFSRDKADDFVRHFFSPGVHYLVTPDLEVGVRLGWGLNDQSARFFSNVGLGLRF